MAREVGKTMSMRRSFSAAISALAVQLTERGIKSVPRFDLTSHAIKLSLPRGGSLDASALDVFSGALQRDVELAE